MRTEKKLNRKREKIARGSKRENEILGAELIVKLSMCVCILNRFNILRIRSGVILQVREGWKGYKFTVCHRPLPASTI